MAEDYSVGSTGREFERLVAIMDRLRSPGGCPWDGEQTHQSLVRYLIEEAYEVVEAIEAGEGIDRQLLKEELGDVLLQVVFHARVASEVAGERGGFDIGQVVYGLNEKLLRRHPHVFAGESADIADVSVRWEELKRQEKPERTSPFDGIPPHLPALALAEKTLAKAQKSGIDVVEVPVGDLAESGGSAGTPLAGFAGEEELGAALFSMVASARKLGLDPERALRTYTRQVIERSVADD